MGNKCPRVSIIVPMFNRASLLTETVSSIIQQSYVHWECIFIDDGSTDINVEVVKRFIALDNRIKLIERNKSTAKKGGNVCRNLGLDSAKGEYIIFFDSDDVMTTDHIQVKIDAIRGGDFDMAVVKTKTLEDGSMPDHFYYDLNNLSITLENYVQQKINWLTCDVIIKSEVAKATRFNEDLKSGQEYNYYCKILSITTKVIKVDKIVTLRRMHGDSIQGRLSGILRIRQQQEAHYVTFMELKKYRNKVVNKHLLRIVLRNGYQIADFSAISSKSLTRELWTYSGLMKASLFFITLVSIKVNKKVSNFLLKSL